MYAVVKTGGKQYKVTIGDKLRVEKLLAEQGESVSLGGALMVADGDKITVGNPALDIAVTATVTGHGRGNKIRVFKMKRRKNYRRTQGHRQSFTEVEITAIGDTVAIDKPTISKAKSKVDPKTTTKVATKSKAEAKAKTTTKSKPEAKTTTKATTKNKAEPKAKTKTKVKTKTKSTAESKAKTKTKVKTKTG